VLNTQDLASFIAPERHLGTSPGDDKYSPRWDLVPGSNFGKEINIQDMTALFAGASAYPAMFGGQRAFGNTCPYAP
jgi:hypothetical protein